MKAVKVLLKTDVPKLGSKGEIVTVKWGYAKNYLIPKGLAVEATPSVLKSWENEQKLKRQAQARRRMKMEKLASQMRKLKVRFALRVNEEGKPYGSIGPDDVLEKLKDMGYDLPKGSVLMEDNISELGSFPVRVRLHPEVETEIRVVVEPA